MIRMLATILVGPKYPEDTRYHRTVGRVERNIRKILSNITCTLLLIAMVIGFGYACVNAESDCVYGECHCYERYDEYGYCHNDNPFAYHCTVHGDGHDCY